MVKKMSGFSNFELRRLQALSAQARSVPKEAGEVISAQNQRGDRLHRSGVWSCNEWDQLEPSLIKLLEKEGLDVIPLKVRHSELLGGGPHCITLDVRRTGTLQRYFD